MVKLRTIRVWVMLLGTVGMARADKPALVSIAVQPSSYTVLVGQSFQFAAVGT